MTEIGAGDVPQILVFNKLDRMEPLPRVLQDWIERPGTAPVQRVFVSALRGTGLDSLRALIAQLAQAGGLNAADPTASVAPTVNEGELDPDATPEGAQLPSATT